MVWVCSGVFGQTLSVPRAIHDWIVVNVTYDLNHDSRVWGGEHWQTTEETLALRRGDCEDLAFLMQEWLKIDFDIPAELLVVEVKKAGRYLYHVVVRVGEVIYDPSNNVVISIEILEYLNLIAVLDYPAAKELVRTRR